MISVPFFAGRLPGLFFITTILLLLSLRPVVGEERSAVAHPDLVTAATLEARIAKTEADARIGEETKTRLLESYRKALENVQRASANATAAEEFQQAAEGAPERITAIRKEIAELAKRRDEDSIDMDPSAPLRQLEQRLRTEMAELVATDAMRSDLEKRLDAESHRPARIRQRLIEAREQMEEAAAKRGVGPSADEGPATAEARRWLLETRVDALRTEIEMLDHELLSHDLRLQLLQTKRDRAVAGTKQIRARIEHLEQLIFRARQSWAERFGAEAESIRRLAEGKQPAVARLAEQNVLLSQEFIRAMSELRALADQVRQTDDLALRLETQYRRAEDTIAIGGLTQELGHRLHRQRQSMPSLRTQNRAAQVRKDQAEAIGARRLIHQDEEAELQDMDSYLLNLLADAKVADSPALREQLNTLASERADLLEAALAIDNLAVRRLDELKSAQKRLRQATDAYNGFLDANLVLVRSRSLFELIGSYASSDQPWGSLPLSSWRELGRTLMYQATHSPVIAVLAVAVMVLLLARKRLIGMIQAQSHKLGKPTTDRFGYTVWALALTLITAAVWPLLMGATGWQLKVSPEATDFSTHVGVALTAVATHFYHLRALRLACISDGLAAAHFRWPESSLRLLRSELDRLSWIFVPAALASAISAGLDPLDVGWGIGRFTFLIAIGSLAFSLYRLLHPGHGVFTVYLRGRQRGVLARVYRFGYPLLALSPLAFGLLSLMGYRLTAGTLTSLFLETLWLAVTLIVVAALAQRWLLVSRRRLAYEAAMDRREERRASERRADAMLTGGEEDAQPAPEEPEVDVVGLSDRGRQLVNTAILLYGLFGLWMIWSDLLPALGILDQFTLWHRRVLVDGQEQILPVTLAGVGLALIYTAITVVLAKQLPAVLEILLLQYTEMSSGSRYTITTLTNYAIITIGLVLVFKTLGADWSQLQWLVAALGVGIGFGLQEIIANFVSGIIILFERPIRVGDVVTVGDTDGVVTRIRGRATTIRNWDGKELLVPNKEFITGRLLNWSLSDQATRIILAVGVAYGSNVRQAMRLLEEAAGENPNVLEDPAPSVIFETFGDNALGLVLRCFVASVDLRYSVMSALNEDINDKFNAAGIAIAFPQRDLHLDTVRPLQVELRREGRLSAHAVEGVVPSK